MIIYYESGNIRINKNDSIDKRYKAGREYLKTHRESKPTVGKRIAKKEHRSKAVAWVFFFYIAFMAGYFWGSDKLEKQLNKAMVKPLVSSSVVQAKEPEVKKEKSVEDMIASYAWDVNLATAIFTCESKLNPEAVNQETGDYGVIQLHFSVWKDPIYNKFGYTLKDMFDADANIRVGYWIWDRGDGIEGNGMGSFNPWVCYTADYYLPYMR